MFFRVYASDAGAVPYVPQCHGEEQEICTSDVIYEEDKSSVYTAWVRHVTMMDGSMCA
jgi:hypothetical protein